MEKSLAGKRIGIIGRGSIGTRLRERLEENGATIVFVYHTETEEAYHEVLEKTKPDAVGLTISTKDKGQQVAFFIADTVKKGIPIVTCEKGSLSYMSYELQEYMPHVWYSASAGGGTMILGYVRLRNLNGKPVTVDMIINGTANYILSRTYEGATLGLASEESGMLGYSEPGASSYLSLLNGEMKDVMMKSCLFYNTVLYASDFITPNDLGTFSLTESQLKRLSGTDRTYRIVVTFSNHDNEVYGDYFCDPVTYTTRDGWFIVVGLREFNNKANQQWMRPGVDNSICITEGAHGLDGSYTLSGPGAGKGPTTNAMITDFKDIFGI